MEAFYNLSVFWIKFNIKNVFVGLQRGRKWMAFAGK
jgi:hypothetical protein